MNLQFLERAPGLLKGLGIFHPTIGRVIHQVIQNSIAYGLDNEGEIIQARISSAARSLGLKIERSYDMDLFLIILFGGGAKRLDDYSDEEILRAYFVSYVFAFSNIVFDFTIEEFQSLFRHPDYVNSEAYPIFLCDIIEEMYPAKLIHAPVYIWETGNMPKVDHFWALAPDPERPIPWGLYVGKYLLDGHVLVLHDIHPRTTHQPWTILSR